MGGDGGGPLDLLGDAASSNATDSWLALVQLFETVAPKFICELEKIRIYGNTHDNILWKMQLQILNFIIRAIHSTTPTARRIRGEESQHVSTQLPLTQLIILKTAMSFRQAQVNTKSIPILL